MKKRISIIICATLIIGSLATTMVVADLSSSGAEQSDVISDGEGRPYITDGTDTPSATADAATGPAASASTGQAASAKYTKKVSYKKIRKKLKGKRTRANEFKDVNKKKSMLISYGYHKEFKIPHVGYGDFVENIQLKPTITAKKKGNTSTLSLGMIAYSSVEIRGGTKRKYKKMIISGGGESVTLKGSSSSTHKRLGEFKNYLLKTTAKFTLSKNTSATDEKIEKLARILSSNNLKITVKDSAKKVSRKCGIDSTNSEKMVDILNDYKSLLKKYEV